VPTLTLLAAAVLATITASSGAAVTTHPLPGVSSEATVASCGARLVVRTDDGRLLWITPDGTTSMPKAAPGSLAMFRGRGSRCLMLDATRGLLDVTGPPVTQVHGLAGTLPNVVTAAAQSDDGSVWFGVGGSNQIGVLESGGETRYYDLPQTCSATGALRPA
jgi:hypothetical protein